MQPQHTHRRVPLRHNKGWGFALFIVALAIAVNSAVAYFHFTQNARTPNDLMYHAAGTGK